MKLPMFVSGLFRVDRNEMAALAADKAERCLVVVVRKLGNLVGRGRLLGFEEKSQRFIPRLLDLGDWISDGHKGFHAIPERN